MEKIRQANREICYAVCHGEELLQCMCTMGSWADLQMYKTVLNTYTKYGIPIVVFDGYESGSSTKDATH